MKIDDLEVSKVIGSKFYLGKTAENWKFMDETDEGIDRISLLCTKCISENVLFWNVHVALAFLAGKFQPKSYLEVGVRHGGSLVQVLDSPFLKNVVAMDVWEGNFFSPKDSNPLNTLQNHIQSFQDKKGIKVPIEYIKGNSHIELKKLIEDKRTFDLILIDGDHSLIGARKDLEEAFQLLSEKGVVVFDDVMLGHHEYLLGVAQDIKKKFPNLTLIITTQDNGCAIFLKNVSWESLC